MNYLGQVNLDKVLALNIYKGCVSQLYHWVNYLCLLRVSLIRRAMVYVAAMQVTYHVGHWP